MTFNDYQVKALTSATYPGVGSGSVIYPTLGLVGEAGEVAEKVKKMIRDGGGTMTPEIRVAVMLEVSDVLWYVAAIATELNFRLDDVAQANLDKLASRKARGVLGGSGDSR